MAKIRVLGPHGNGFPWMFYKITMLLALLSSMHSYFFFHINYKYTAVAFASAIILLLLIKRKLLSWNISNIISIILLSASYFYTLPDGNMNLYIVSLLLLIPLYGLILLKDELKIDLINDISSIFACLIGISVIAWLLNFGVISLPSFFDYYGVADDKSSQDYQYIYLNHFLFLENVGTTEMYPRFSFIFLEPGYLSIFIVFLLYIRKFNFQNKVNLFYLLGLICSLSLAGYIMGFSAFIAHLYSRGEKKVFMRLLMVMFFLLLFYGFFSNYNNGNNIINNAIFSRLEWEESTGRITGYNRTNERIDDDFESFLSSKDVIWGLGSDIEKGASVGYKPYILMYGFCGLGLFILTIFYVYFKRRCFDSFILFLIFLTMFARGHHVIYYQGFWLLYVCGIAKMYAEKSIQSDKIYGKNLIHRTL